MFGTIWIFLKILSIVCVIRNVDTKSIPSQLKAIPVNKTELVLTPNDHEYREIQLKFSARKLPFSENLGAPPSPFLELHGANGYNTTEMLSKTCTPEWPEVFEVLRVVGKHQKVIAKVFDYNNGTGHSLIGSVDVPLLLPRDDCQDVFFNISGTTAELVVKVLNCNKQSDDGSDDDEGGGIVWWKIVIYVVAGLIALAMVVVCCKTKLLAELTVILVWFTCRDE